MIRNLFLGLLFCGWTLGASAEDGSRLWLRQDTTASATIDCLLHSQTLNIAQRELNRSWKGVPVTLQLCADKEHLALGKDGYTIRTDQKSYSYRFIVGNRTALCCLSSDSFTGNGIDLGHLDIKEKPAYEYRILNHWDNLDGTIERGYAGHSLWKWEELPDVLSPRYEAYARANASVGINGTVLNNVNASPEILSDAYLLKVKALADVFRPYGLKVYCL